MAGEEGSAALDGVSFQVRAGEILGVAGVQGNGQTELCEALLGLRPAVGGSVRLDGRDLTRATPQQRLRAGHRLHPRGPPGRRAGGRVLGGRQPRPGRLRPAALSPGIALNLGTDPRDRSRAGGRLRHPHHLDRDPGGHAVRRQPAEGHPGPGDRPATCGCWWPASRPAAWTWAPSSSCTGGSWRSGTRAWRCCIISSELDEIYALSDRIAVMYEGKITGFRDAGRPRGGTRHADGRRDRRRRGRVPPRRRTWARPAPRPG